MFLFACSSTLAFEATYDYWCHTNFQDLHPIGWCDRQGRVVSRAGVAWTVALRRFGGPARVRVVLTTYRTETEIIFTPLRALKLQKPKNYSKAFNWATYLREVRAPAVPEHLFTAQQRKLPYPPPLPRPACSIYLEVTKCLAA